MRLYEYESKRLLNQVSGIPIPSGIIASTPGETFSAASSLGKNEVVLKAQILQGGRGKAGGIVFAGDPQDAKSHSINLLNKELLGSKIKKILVEECLNIEHELYVAITYDECVKQPIILASKTGGVDINQLVEEDESRVVRIEINPHIGLQSFQAYSLGDALGLPVGILNKCKEIFLGLWEVFSSFDATLVEVNPLVITEDGQVLAADAHIDIEGDALFRQTKRLNEFEIPTRDDKIRPLTKFEIEANEIDKADYRGVAGRVIEFDGDLGLLIGAGGGSLTIFDAIKRYGGSPANYCEVGGNPPVDKVYRLAKLILSKQSVRGLAVITCVFSNSRVDFIARGVVKALVELNIDPAQYPIYFRSAGAFQEDGYAILGKYSISYHGRETSLDDAARAAVKMMNDWRISNDGNSG